MLVNYCVTLVFVAVLSCDVSAFTTRFVSDDVGEAKKPQVDVETSALNTEKYNATEEHKTPEAVEVKVIPIMTDVFTQPEDLMNMTPLKLVTAITAQHLLSTVQNIPVKSNSVQDVLNMFSSIVKEINKTASIIKLTTEYVNISGHYMMSALNKLNQSNCQLEVVQESINTIRKKFYKSIVDHVVGSVKELNDRTRQREMTGNDILISSAYHIVTAFQEMTNQVMLLTEEIRKKCSSPPPSIEVTPASGEQANSTINNDNDGITQEQANAHKSIKKDQATTKPEIEGIRRSEKYQDFVTMEKLNNDHQDLTVEVFAPGAVIENGKISKLENQEQQPIQYLKLSEVPVVKTISSFQILKNEKQHEDKETTSNFGKQETKIIDKELASSAVDSLSNVPWQSSETEGKGLDKTFIVTDMERSPQSQWNIWQFLAPKYQTTLQQEQKQQCDDSIVPVCGIDNGIKKFIIFLNDCKRDAYNKVYGTSYYKSNMDTCLRLFLRNQRNNVEPQFYVNSRNIDMNSRPR